MKHTMTVPRGGIVALMVLVAGILPGTTADAQVLCDMLRCDGKGSEGKERVAPIQLTVPPEVGLDIDWFWKIIRDTRSGARDDEHFLRRIDSRLKKLSPDELMKFESVRSRLDAEAYSWTLWGAAYLMISGCGDDCFNYFRAWLMSLGRKTFENALKDPDTLADLDRRNVRVREFEEFMYAAQELYETKTDQEMPESVLFQGGARPELGDRWDFDDNGEMKKRYPKLFSKYRKP